MDQERDKTKDKTSSPVVPPQVAGSKQEKEASKQGKEKTKDKTSSPVVPPQVAGSKQEKEKTKDKTSSPVVPPQVAAVTAKDLFEEGLSIGKVHKAKGSKNIRNGICCISATFNNTKISFTDPLGNVIAWSSAGKMNFRGSRKSTAYAAQVATQNAGKVALAHGMKEVVAKVRGAGMGRDSAIRALQSLGLQVSAIVDTTPLPHNGCRPRKHRRV